MIGSAGKQNRPSLESSNLLSYICTKNYGLEFLLQLRLLVALQLKYSSVAAGHLLTHSLFVLDYFGQIPDLQ